MNVGVVTVGTCADFLNAFFPVRSLHSLLSVYTFPWFVPLLPPSSDDSTRLSRILGMAFPAAAESELSHFTDRTVARVVSTFSEGKQAGQHHTAAILVRRAVCP